MRNLFLRGAAVIAIGVSVAANAADMPVKAPPFLPEPPYNWSGGYVGANFGGAWTSGHLNIPNNNFYDGLTEFIGGVQAGYNFQAGHLLLGVEGDFDGATFGHPALPTPTLGSVSQDWIGTIAGRIGLVEDRWLVPIGGGFGRIFKISDQPVSANIAAYYNVAHPTGMPNWQLRAQLSLLFPER